MVHVSYVSDVRRGLAVTDGIDPGQSGGGARGQVREMAGRVKSIDDDRPPARQGEDKRVL
jgi:hypothetical protein